MSFRDHAIVRARQRYGVRLDAWDYDFLCAQIASARDATARLIVRQSERIGIWLVRHARVWMVAVFDHRAGAVTTFLPLDAMFDDQGLRLWGDEHVRQKKGAP